MVRSKVQTPSADAIQAIAIQARDAARTFDKVPGDHAGQAFASGLLPALHAIQEEYGWIDASAIAPLASAFNISQAEVRGVLSFYHDFRLQPPSRHVLKLCRAEACQAMGCETLVEHLAENHRLKPGQTTPGGELMFEEVYCLGLCALAPAALLDDAPIGRLDAAKVDSAIRGAKT